MLNTTPSENSSARQSIIAFSFRSCSGGANNGVPGPRISQVWVRDVLTKSLTKPKSTITGVMPSGPEQDVIWLDVAVHQLVRGNVGHSAHQLTSELQSVCLVQLPLLKPGR